uniref:Olfactory receptor n=1 Tax=Nothobranchius furzeri TaxID=105023 RepID=A0A8C6LAS6_NOTFU
MDYKLNETYITFGGFVEMVRFRHVYFVIIFTFYIMILGSNSTIVCLIVIYKNLHYPMYIFIAALLMNSLFYTTAIYPKLLLDLLSDKQIISRTMCYFQYYIFYTSVGAEFMLLTAMAYDRYVSICKPLEYPNIMKRTTICVLLVLAWLGPACAVAGSAFMSAKEKVCYFTLKGLFCNNSIYKLNCIVSRTLSVYGIIFLLSIAFLPMIYIIFTYTRIFVVCYHGSKNVRRKAVQTCTPHLMVLLNFSLLSAYDIIVVRLETNISQSAHFLMTLQLIMYTPLINPIIYGLKMSEIFEKLRRLFCQVK